MKINSYFSTQGRFLIHHLVAHLLILSVNIQVPTMCQALGEAYTLPAFFLYNVILGNAKGFVQSWFLLECRSIVVPVLQVFKFSCTSSLSVPTGLWSSTQGPPWTHDWYRRTPRTPLQYGEPRQLRGTIGFVVDTYLFSPASLVLLLISGLVHGSNTKASFTPLTHFFPSSHANSSPLLDTAGSAGDQRLSFFTAQEDQGLSNSTVLLIRPAELSPLPPRWYSKCLLCGWQ